MFIKEKSLTRVMVGSPPSGKEISIKSVAREIRERKRLLAHLIKAADAAESCASTRGASPRLLTYVHVRVGSWQLVS